MKMPLLPALVGMVCFLGLTPVVSWSFSFSNASDTANREADSRMYQERSYANARVQGPSVIVMPGEIKSNNATFRQKITANNIKDFAELELSRANFRVLERGDIDSLLREQQLAHEMGSADRGQFKKGQFKTTKWFVRFDILKAEPVAAASQGFDGGVAGDIAGSLIRHGRTAAAVDTGVSSVQYRDSAKVWVIGMRYKVMDASTSEQVTSGYLEKKMEVDETAKAALGFSGSQQRGVTLDTMVQQLVGEAVARIDARNK